MKAKLSEINIRLGNYMHSCLAVLLFSLKEILAEVEK